VIFITDPWFYAWAIPAVIITGISKTGLGAGVGGVAVPMMSQVIAPGVAAGIMLPILCVMDVLGLRAYRGKWAWSGVKHMMLPALIGIAIGALSFNSLSVNTTKVLLGAISVAFSLYQRGAHVCDVQLPEHGKRDEFHRVHDCEKYHGDRHKFGPPQLLWPQINGDWRAACVSQRGGETGQSAPHPGPQTFG